ncbi:class I SAM-dependent methyltransferase [Gloeothece verrucosa]|uniref:Methyltransferase type 12 n=1 Tax=Gloeothece verrucosa (strain PCC 7822) TaxID=497965 RepID=E0UNA9_GLOV7|nr:class I SAM-dependent methyltransferase [Gloeothece verrucosa]ADN18439.1 Methyltransferase type 12 [Gloeothece verrucosa PCC 7822]
MSNQWKIIWNKRQISHQYDSILESLMRANGYDSKFSMISEEEWKNYIFKQGKKLNISPNDSIFEVGCGSGAFLYPFYQQGHKIAGIDYSEPLIKLASETMLNGDFQVKEAINLNTENQCDIVVSSGVFIYFPTYEYGAEVLKKMQKLARKSIGIFDVSDLDKKEQALAKRKSILGEKEYEKKYRGLEHLFYSKDWFYQQLASESVKVIIEDQKIAEYDHADYRFNIYIHKI